MGCKRLFRFCPSGERKRDKEERGERNEREEKKREERERMREGERDLRICSRFIFSLF